MLRLALVLVVFVGFAGSGTLSADENRASKADAVFLAYHEPDKIDQEGWPAPFLVRELVRQAFLIAARDECGLLTRDKTLRDAPPATTETGVVPFDFECAMGPVKNDLEVRYTLSRPIKNAPQMLWEYKLHIRLDKPDFLTKLAEVAEALSRGELNDVVKKTGLAKSVPAARAAAPLPHEAEDELWQWNELAVFGAVRRIHEEIRKHGESPELVAGLAIGYANLGSLTSYYFSPAHKVFSARALLYAERLRHMTGSGSAWAQWHRAYVRTLVGLHTRAAEDIAAAKDAQSKTPAARPLPFWTEVIDLFCQGHIPHFVQKATPKLQRQLARYLEMEAVVYSNVGSLITKNAEAVVPDSPDCFRAWDAMCVARQLGVVLAVANGNDERLAQSLQSRLPQIPGFPESLAKRLSETRKGDIEFREHFVTDLKAETARGSDNWEPSLSALGGMIEEIEFSQLIRILQVNAPVSTRDTYRPLFENHPYAPLIDTYGTQAPEAREAVKKLADYINPSEIGYVEALVLRPRRRYDETHVAFWLQTSYAHADPVFRDEMLGIQVGAAGGKNNKATNEPYVKRLWNTSKLPAAVAVRINRDWRHARKDAAKAERDYEDDANVMAALTSRYLELEQYEDAERCAQQRIRIAPDYPTYRVLANIYKQQGDMFHWKQTLEKSLQLPSRDLEDARVRDEIARYHMDRKEWKEAVVYADAAAQCYAAWALLTAARCHEMLGDWKQSEALTRAVSENYDNVAFDWMVWCCRTGHGDVAAAEACARKQFESLGTQATPAALAQIGTYYLLRKEPEKALIVFQKAYDDGRTPYAGMLAASTADSLGKSAERDTYLTRVADAARNLNAQSVGGVYGRVAKLMQEVLPPGNVKDFDFKQIDSIIQIASGSKRPGPTNLSYFVGVFLKNRGETEKSSAYLIRAAQASTYRDFTCALACQILRDLKVPVPVVTGPGDPEVDDDSEAVGPPVNRGRATRTNGRGNP